MGGKVKTMTDFIFLDSKITVNGDCHHEIKRHLLLEEKLWQLRQLIKKQKHHFDHQGLSSQNYGFSNSCVRMYVLNHKES